VCGKKVNYKDYEIKNNIFLAGPSYPSIDHILPLSKGGAHTWDNIMLAHRQCNWLKGDHESFECMNGQMKFAL
jgi:5-methylcytosine-specific restriction endonuclease McrA